MYHHTREEQCRSLLIEHLYSQNVVHRTWFEWRQSMAMNTPSQFFHRQFDQDQVGLGAMSDHNYLIDLLLDPVNNLVIIDENKNMISNIIHLPDDSQFAPV